MKKMIIALMLIIPLLFLFTVFSAVKAGGLNVAIPVNGIQIRNKPAEGTLYLDMAKDDSYTLQASVTPQNAANKGYKFSVEPVEGSDFADVAVDENGNISAGSLGAARIVVTSDDGGYTDSMDVIVNSSSTVAVVPSLYYSTDTERKGNLLQKDGDVYRASVSSGTYTYSAATMPAGADQAVISVDEGFAVVDEASHTVMLPRSGKVSITFTADGGKKGKVSSRMELSVSKTSNVSGILVNGEDNATVMADRLTRKCTAYINSDSEFTLAGADFSYLEGYEIKNVYDSLYEVTMNIGSDAPDTLRLEIVCDDKRQNFEVSVADFAFSVKAGVAVQTGEEVSLIAGREIILYAVSPTVTEGISYRWQISGNNSGGATVSYEGDGSTCLLYTGEAGGNYTVECSAYRGEVATDTEVQTLEVHAVNNASSITFNDPKAGGLAKSVAIGEYKYSADGVLVKNDYSFLLKPFDINGGNVNVSDFEITVSDPAVAAIRIISGKAFLQILSTGEVTVTAQWRCNANYGVNVSAAYRFTAVRGGAEVTCSDDYYAATQAGYPIILRTDIMLGTDRNGQVYSLEKRASLTGRMKSTYNTAFLNNSGMDDTVLYAAEIRNDLYGNGFTLNAHYIAKAEDSTGKPLLFKGALPLVGVYSGGSQVMKVSAQDNISFLIRTDGVTVSNVTLQGCSDDALTDGDSIDLTGLDNTGTVLDINADCRILNCRIRNGKTGVRVYGGNRQGGEFAVQQNTGNPLSDDDRIIVEINGCILSQTREFLLKTGANRALKSDLAKGDEPALTDANGNAYDENADLLNDAYFYDRYVMTDLTVENSVFENSGLFSVGIESNFSGGVLNADKVSEFDFAANWGVGGTMYASVIRFKGDVRFYDWKVLDSIDSSKLVEVSSDGMFANFQLNVRKMMECVVEDAERRGDTSFDNMFTIGEDGKTYINSAIVKYGGGRNYAQLDMSQLDARYTDFDNYNVNISVLTTSSDPDLKKQGEYMPLAAGSRDFRFIIYGKTSANSLSKQISDRNAGISYSGVVPVR